MANAAVTAHGQSTALAVNQITLDHPWEWLAKGWRDLASAPRFSLLYGSVLVLVSCALTLGLMSRELFFIVPRLAGSAAGRWFLSIGAHARHLHPIPWPDRDHAPWSAMRPGTPTGIWCPVADGTAACRPHPSRVDAAT